VPTYATREAEHMHRQRTETPYGIKKIKLRTAASKLKKVPGIKNGTI